MNNKSLSGVLVMAAIVFIDAFQDFRMVKSIVKGVKSLSR